MTNNEDVKKIVRDKYGSIANQHSEDSASCCSTTCCSDGEITVFAEDYSQSPGYVPDADLKLGCGMPVDLAAIKAGDTVVDLGAGAGNDAFVARSIAGADGRVIGIDMTPAMIERGRLNAHRLGFTNVDFILGDIEAIPLPDNTADVVVSNCVLNLVPDKNLAFSEMYRIMKPGGHFAISDVVTYGTLPDDVRSSAELYVGCVAGAIDADLYLETVRQAGFHNVQVRRRRSLTLPDNIVLEGSGVDSVTITGVK